MIFTYDEKPEAEQAQRHFEQKAIISAGEVNAKEKHITKLSKSKSGCWVLLVSMCARPKAKIDMSLLDY